MLHGEGVAAAVTLAPSAFDFGGQAAGDARAPPTASPSATKAAPRSTSTASRSSAPTSTSSPSPATNAAATSLAPGSECLVRVRFAPDSAGAKTATLRVRGDAGTFTASLAGNGTATGFAAGAGPIASATSAAPCPRPRPPAARRHRRHFARGSAIASVSSRSHRADLHGGAVPR